MERNSLLGELYFGVSHFKTTKALTDKGINKGSKTLRILKTKYRDCSKRIEMLNIVLVFILIL